MTRRFANFSRPLPANKFVGRVFVWICGVGFVMAGAAFLWHTDTVLSLPH